MTLINAYTANSIKDNDEALFVIKIMFQKRGDKLFYRLYRCAHPATPRSNSYSLMGQSMPKSELLNPQGDRIIGTNQELDAICHLLFPIALRVCAVPDYS